LSSNCVVIYVLCFLLAFETTEGNMWTWMQVELLLGKAYSEWGGHSGDAVAVYDGLISSHPDDFRGYLAKGILLKDQGKASDAERMFIQVSYCYPEL
jgi:hypothetical protein